MLIQGNPKLNKLAQALLFVATGTGSVASGNIKFEETETEDQVLIDNEPVLLALDTFRLVAPPSELNDVTAKWASAAIDSLLVYGPDTMNELNTEISASSSTFLSGDEPNFGDFLICAAIQNWNNTSTPAQKMAAKAALGYLGKAKKTQYFKKVAAATTPTRAIADPTRWKLVVGKVLRVWEHDGSDKLWCEEIDIGEDSPRRIGSGLRSFVSKEEFEGKLVIVLANMKSKSLGGFPSHGMVICASNSDHSIVELLQVPKNSKIGDVVAFEGLSGEPDTVLTSKKNADTITGVMEILKTDDSMVVMANGHRMMLNGEPVTSQTLKNAHVG